MTMSAIGSISCVSMPSSRASVSGRPRQERPATAEQDPVDPGAGVPGGEVLHRAAELLDQRRHGEADQRLHVRVLGRSCPRDA